MQKMKNKNLCYIKYSAILLHMILYSDIVSQSSKKKTKLDYSYRIGVLSSEMAERKRNKKKS